MCKYEQSRSSGGSRLSMKFLVDAHLPNQLAAQTNVSAPEALHLSRLAAEKYTQDAVVNQISMDEQRIDEFRLE